MATEWYLMNTDHDAIDGFESDAFDDFGQDAFSESLDSSMGVNVELCNFDLSEIKPIKAIVLNTVQDTELKTMKRNVLVPVGTCKTGMYIKYKNRYWLIVGLVDDNHVYEKAVVTICNYLLTWLNDNNQIVQRWCNVSSASQYNNGETSSKYYFVRSDQLLIATPDDDECLLLDSGKRFIIDRRCEVYEKHFDDDVVRDTNNPLIVYRLTRSDSALYNYSDSGYYQMLVTQDEKHEEDGYYVVDGKGYWICGEPTIKHNETSILSCEIQYDSLEIYNGFDEGTYTAIFYDTNGNIIDNTPTWNLSGDIVDMLDVDYVGNSILISANNKNLTNKSFELSLEADGYETAKITIAIRAFM